MWLELRVPDETGKVGEAWLEVILVGEDLGNRSLRLLLSEPFEPIQHQAREAGRRQQGPDP